VADAQHGAFVLCRTSNPGGADLQDRLVLDGDGGTRRAWAVMADLARSWNHRGNVGLVVGATRPNELAAIRRRAPDLWILAPGVGAQGGSLHEALSAGLRADGSGLLITVSRGISRAPDPGAAAADLVARIRAHEPRAERGSMLDLRTTVARGLLDAGCVRFGEFTLKSGLKSPIYIDLRRLIGFPSLLADVGRLLSDRARDLQWDVLAPLPYAAMPIGSAMSLQLSRPMVYPRREVKDYGTKAQVEGVFEPGHVALVVDDLATTGGSKLEGFEKLRGVGLVVHDVLVLIDRESGATEAMASADVGLHAVYTLTELLGLWQDIGAIRRAQVAEVKAFLAASRS
jgi:uridine monophosphate synthetase